MTLTVAPPVGVKCASVGVFWKVGTVLLVDTSTLDDAEPYGDCITHRAGHYELWEKWQGIGAARLKALGYPTTIAVSEYDAWPRGRVVFENRGSRFVIFADRRLQKADTVLVIIAAFGLSDRSHVVRSDAHYRASAPNDWDG